MINLVPVASHEKVYCKGQPYLGRIADEYFVLYFTDGQYMDSYICPYKDAIFYKDEETYLATELHEVARIT